MDEGHTQHGKSNVWHVYYVSKLQPALEKGGFLMYASSVVDGPDEVSERERAACENLLDLDTQMQHLLVEMQEIAEAHNRSISEQSGRGVIEAEKWLESLSKGAVSQHE